MISVFLAFLASMAMAHEVEPFTPDATCTVPAEVRADFLHQPGLEFDQSPLGWRTLAKAECYDAAGSMIADYILFSPNRTDVTDRLRNLRFHAGQMAGFAGDRAKAVEYFHGALGIDDAVSENRIKSWNAYVLGTIAFVKGDRKALEKQHEILASTENVEGENINLVVLEGFLACFEKSYGEAYGDQSCQTEYRARTEGGN